MPPPLLRAYLKEDLDALKIEVSTYINKVLPKESPPSFEALIQDWINGLTPEQRSRMYGITEIIQLAGLKGRYRELPAKQMVATALYKCGFSQTRCYKKLFRNRRVWSLGA
jgi:hypothetical protein